MLRATRDLPGDLKVVAKVARALLGHGILAKLKRILP
jgi:hypothetical protein